MGEFDACIDYINQYWEKIVCFNPDDYQTHIGLPHHFVSPNDTKFKNDEFYWDSYFIALGMLASGNKEHVHLIKGVAENFQFMQRKYGIIPLRNRFFNLGISQPPFFSSLVKELHAFVNNKRWLREMAESVSGELRDYWEDERHQVNGLSRYCDRYMIHLTSEHESGWDMTSRFHDKCMHILPVDLNCQLYVYERDLAEFFAELGDIEKQKEFETRAHKRKDLINTYCWDEEQGFYFDYNHHSDHRESFWSLAGFYPLWAGLASKEQAARMRECLPLFEYDSGLANTQKEGLSEEFKQWDYPNGWPNIQYIVIAGLNKYGFEEDAKRIALKWLRLNKKVFEESGMFWEKYDVVKRTVGKSARYPTQSGFGWTNGVFLRLVKDFHLE